MSDLIRRGDVEEALQGLHVGDVRFFEKLRKALDEIPSAEPEHTAKVMRKQETHIVTPPKSTTIAYETETNLWTECGNCGAMGMYHGWKYCPNCGAKLDWSGNE